VFCRAQIALIGLADQGRAPGCCAAVYLSWSTGPPRSGVSPSRSLARDGNSSRSKDETVCARVGAGRMPDQAQTRRKATRTVCPRSRHRPNPLGRVTGRADQLRSRARGHRVGRPDSSFLLQSKVCRHGAHDQHVCRMATPIRPSRRHHAVFGGGNGTRSLLRIGHATRRADGAGSGRGAHSQVVHGLQPSEYRACDRLLQCRRGSDGNVETASISSCRSA
jgi:hypothetical protein